MFGVLPNITPKITFALTLAFTCVYLTKLWFDPTYKRFLDSLVLAAMTSFLWGWHVHEKAALMFLIPLRYVPLGTMQRAEKEADEGDHHSRLSA